MRSSFRFVLFVLLAALGLLPAPAMAAEVWANADGDYVLDAGAFYKSMLSSFRMQRGLVESSEALGTLLGAPDTGLPDYGTTSAHTARAWSRFGMGQHAELQTAWQLAANVASDPVLSPGASLGGGGLPASTEGARRRLIDFDPVLAESAGFVLHHNLDLLAFKAGSEHGDLTIGRQVFSWGSGRLWNPTDLLSPFAPTDIDREVRRGVDAVRASIPIAATAQLDFLWLPQETARDNGGVARGRFNVAEFDISPSVAKYARDLVFGLDTSGDVGPIGVHAEAAWTDALDVDERFLRAVAGVSVQPSSEVFLTGEYYFNGWGTTSPEEYFGILQSPRVTRGEVFGAGRHYLGLVSAWQATGLLNLQAISIINLTDPSFLLVPALEYSAAQNVLMRFGGYVPLGRRVDASGLKALMPVDVVTRSAAWRRESTSLGLRSEYGASPLGLFVQVAVYFL